MGMTPEGDVIPSYMNLTASWSGENGYTRGLQELTFRFGQIKAVYAPNAASNINKRFFEYDVSVQHVSEGGSQSQVLYPRCQMGSLFGGVADHFRWTPRVTTGNDGQQQGKPGLNSIVMLLCLNGNIRQGLIIGAIKHPSLPKELDEGQYLEFEYNGIQVIIDDGGAMQLLRRGATKDDGKVRAENKNQGAKFILNSNGAITLANGDAGQILNISGPDDKTVDIEADQNLNLTTARDMTLHSTSDFGSIFVGGKQESMILGKTYRQNESKMLHQLSAQLSAISVLIAAAAAGITSAAAAPGAQSLAAAGTALVQASTALNSCSTAIDAFEAETIQYLSQHVFVG